MAEFYKFQKNRNPLQFCLQKTGRINAITDFKGTMPMIPPPMPRKSEVAIFYLQQIRKELLSPKTLTELTQCKDANDVFTIYNENQSGEDNIGTPLAGATIGGMNYKIGHS